MTPYSIYRFKKAPDRQTKYILESVEGVEFDGLLQVGQRGKYKGVKSISFEEKQRNTGGASRQFTHCLKGARHLTSFNFTEKSLYKSYGDNKHLGFNDCVLIEFNTNFQILTLSFYKDCANISKQLFDSWIKGGLEEL